MTRARDVATQGGLVLLTSNTFTTASGVIFDNVFTSTYQNYKLVINLTTVSVRDFTYFRMRANGTDYSGSGYSRIYSGLQSPSVVDNGGSSSVTAGLLTFTDTGQNSISELIVSNPQTTGDTLITGNAVRQEGSTVCAFLSIGNSVNTSTQYDGINIYCASGTMTGTILIYGMKN